MEDTFRKAPSTKAQQSRFIAAMSIMGHIAKACGLCDHNIWDVANLF